MKKGVKRTIVAFSLSSFLNDVGSDMIRPFWPLFVTSFLGAPMYFLGLIDGLGDFVSYSVRFPAGYLSDRFRKQKVFIWIGYLFATLSKIGYALSRVFYFLIPFKIMDRLGKLRDPPRDAMLSVLVRKEKKGRYFGYLTAADNMGATVGPLIGMLLFGLLGYVNLFLVAAVPGLIAVFVILFCVKEKRYVKSNGFHFRLNSLGSSLKRLIFVSGLFGLGWFSLSFMVVFVSGYMRIGWLPLLFVVLSLFASLTSAFVGWLSDYIGRRYLLAVGYFLFGVVCLGFVNFKFSYLFIFGLFALYGIHYGMVTSLQSAFVSDLCHKDVRGSAIGLFQTVLGSCMLVASIVAGLLWERVGVSSVFWYGFGFALVSCLLLVLIVGNE